MMIIIMIGMIIVLKMVIIKKYLPQGYNLFPSLILEMFETQSVKIKDVTFNQ